MENGRVLCLNWTDKHFLPIFFLQKSTKLLPPWLLFFPQICTTSFFGWGFAPDIKWWVYSAPPDPLTVLGRVFNPLGKDEKEGKGKEKRWGKKKKRKGVEEGKGREKEGRGRGGSGGRVLIETFPSPWQWGTKYMYDKIRTPFECSFIRDTYILTFLSSNTFCLRYWICKDASYMHLWQNSSVVSPGTLWRRRPCIPLILFYPTILI